MKRKLLVIFLFFLTGIAVTSAQDIHDPAQIMKIMESSKMSYNLDVLKYPVATPDYSEKVNSNDHYRVETDSNIVTYRYKPTLAAHEYFEEAEKSYTMHNFASADYSYRKALGTDSSYLLMYTYIGQMAENDGRIEEAISWYRKAIAKNYIDYMARWFMADNLMRMGNKKEALREITIAHILNRNNPRLIVALGVIWKANGLTYDPWYFTPQCIIEKKDTHNVIIQFDEHWLGYAMAKALWMYEPGYKASMGVPKDLIYSTVEERECLANLYFSLINTKVKMKNYPEFRALERAIENKDLDIYSIYEVLLPQQPFVAYQLSAPVIEQIADYLLKIRSGK